MEGHVKIVGILMLVWGALAALGVIMMLGFTGVMAAEMPGFAQGMMGFFAILFGALAALSLGGGYGLLNHEEWARGITFAVAILSLFSFPIGTAFGIYALWVMTRPGAKDLLAPSPTPPAP